MLVFFQFIFLLIRYFFLILIFIVALFPLPSFATAVILTVPAFFAVTFPCALTVAIFLLEDFHFTFRLDAFAGDTVTFSVWVFFDFRFIVLVLAVIFIFVTLTVCFTAVLSLSVSPSTSRPSSVFVSEL